MAEFNFQNFRDALAAAFWQIGSRLDDGMKAIGQGMQQVVNNNIKSNSGPMIMYPSRLFNLNALTGDWVELARTPNNVQPNNNQSVSHIFSIKGRNIEHSLTQSDKTVSQLMNLDTSDSHVAFKKVNTNLFGNPDPVVVVAVFDEQLNAVTDVRRQQYAYVILAQNNKAWVLARKGIGKNPVVTRQLINYVKRMGYNVSIYHPQLNANQTQPVQQKPQPAQPVQQKPQPAVQQKPQPAVQQKPQPTQEKPQPVQGQELLIPWTVSAFPDNGNGREIHVPSGHVLRFVSPKDESHTVAEALVEEIIDEDTGKKRQIWRRHPEPTITSPPEQVGFNRTLTIHDPGVYYLVCPVDRNHELMRIKLIVNEKNHRRNS